MTSRKIPLELVTTPAISDAPKPIEIPEHLQKQASFHQQVAKRFRLVPNFFVSTPDAPEIIERLWAFAAAAYLDTPIPTLFKERLFVFLSRFCPVRYCIVRHCGFLIGYGHAAGDPAAQTQTIEQMIELLKHLRLGGGTSNRFTVAWRPWKSRSIGPFLVAKSKTSCLRFAL